MICRECGHDFEAAFAVGTFCDRCIDAIRRHDQEEDAAVKKCLFLDRIPALYRAFDFDKLPAGAQKLYGRIAADDASQQMLVIQGATRSGKSFLGYQAARQACDQYPDHPPAMTTGNEMRELLKIHPGAREQQIRVNHLRSIIRAPWLLIDDFGHGNWTPAFSESVLYLLEIRTSRIRPTLITTQWTIDGWINHATSTGPGPPETIAAIAGRLRDWFTTANI